MSDVSMYDLKCEYGIYSQEELFERMDSMCSDLTEAKAEISRLEEDTRRLLRALNAVGLTPEQKSFVERHLEASRPSKAQPTPSKQEKM